MQTLEELPGLSKFTDATGFTRRNRVASPKSKAKHTPHFSHWNWDLRK